MKTIDVPDDENRLDAILDQIRVMSENPLFRGLYYATSKYPVQALGFFRDVLESQIPSAKWIAHGYFEFPSGSTLTLGYSAGNEYQYRSSEFTCIIYDGRTISQQDRAHLLSRLRGPRPILPPELTEICITEASE